MKRSIFKRFLTKLLLLLAVVSVGSVTSCAQNPAKNPANSADHKMKVLSTTQMVGYLVQQVAGDTVTHKTLICGEMDPHSYELVKGDHEKILSSDIVFSNGLMLEHGASLIQLLKGHSCHVPLGDTLLRTNDPRILYTDGMVDPHIWMDVSIFSDLLPQVLQTLISKLPQHQALYEANAKALQESLIELDLEIQSQMQRISPEQRYLVTSHDAFEYFARRYLATQAEQQSGAWVKRITAPEGLAPDGQISSVEIADVVAYLQEHQLTVVFPESNLSSDSLNKIVEVASMKGINVQCAKQKLCGDSLGINANYPDMMKYNARVIEESLRK